MTSFKSSNILCEEKLKCVCLCVGSIQIYMGICENYWIKMRYLLFEHQEGEIKVKSSYSQPLQHQTAETTSKYAKMNSS